MEIELQSLYFKKVQGDENLKMGGLGGVEGERYIQFSFILNQ